MIVLGWVNDQQTKRSYGSKCDANRVFQAMLASGHPPNDWESLMQEAARATGRFQQLAGVGRGPFFHLGGRKGVQQRHTGTGKVSRVARHQRQAMQESCGGNLFVDGVVHLRHSQASPDLCDFSIQGQDQVTELAHHLSEPTLQDLCLLPITAMANQFDAPRAPHGSRWYQPKT